MWILGLRKIQGVSIESFIEKFNENPLNLFKDEISKMQKSGLLKIEKNENMCKTEIKNNTEKNCYIKLTTKGIDFANIVWEEFI